MPRKKAQTDSETVTLTCPECGEELTYDASETAPRLIHYIDGSHELHRPFETQGEPDAQ